MAMTDTTGAMAGDPRVGRPSVLLRINGTAIAAGTERMAIPVGGNHVRAVQIRVPVTFIGSPSVTATVHAVSGAAAAGTTFGVFNIKVNDLGTETQVVIQATNVQAGKGTPDDFDCEYMIIGKHA
jgi:hypothetical protein